MMTKSHLTHYKPLLWCGEIKITSLNEQELIIQCQHLQSVSLKCLKLRNTATQFFQVFFSFGSIKTDVTGMAGV